MTELKDRTAAEIREWVGRTGYNLEIAYKDTPEGELHRFLVWVHNNNQIPLSDAFPHKSWRSRMAHEKIRAGSDEDVVKWYLQWLLEGAKAR